jgi:hypothetical protein
MIPWHLLFNPHSGVINLFRYIYPRSIGGYFILFVQNGLTPIGVCFLRNIYANLLQFSLNMSHKSTENDTNW